MVRASEHCAQSSTRPSTPTIGSLLHNIKKLFIADNTHRSKDDGSGETVGHDSGRRIVEILEKNPKKDPEGYDQDDIDHMRKVVAYCKRHLAQEEKAKQDTNSKSYKSLKNWGHDAQKA
jgi:hypothetical protein